MLVLIHQLYFYDVVCCHDSKVMIQTAPFQAVYMWSQREVGLGTRTMQSRMPPLPNADLAGAQTSLGVRHILGAGSAPGLS